MNNNYLPQAQHENYACYTNRWAALPKIKAGTSHAAMIKTKRVYESPEKEDGFRILVDRLWPRGFTKEKVKANFWFKEAAYSNNLRKMFGHKNEEWDGFRRGYKEELNEKKEFIVKNHLFGTNSSTEAPVEYRCRIHNSHKAMVLNYNFGKTPDFKRAIFTNERKYQDLKQQIRVNLSNPCYTCSFSDAPSTSFLPDK